MSAPSPRRMDFHARRLRRGELIVWPAALVLLGALFLPWYSSGEVETFTTTGWQALTVLRWLIIVTVVAALALTFFQATRRAPALPVTLSVIVTVLGAITTLALVWRVVVADPPALGGRATSSGDGYIALVASVVLTIAALLSLRDEDPPDPEANASIPVVRLPD